MTAPAGLAPRSTGRRPVAAQSQHGLLQRLLALELRAIWSGFLRQSPAFWCASFYVFIEYVRPQQIYREIAFIPWGNISLGSAVLFAAMEGRIAFREKILWAGVALFSLIILASSMTAYNPDTSFESLDVWGTFLLSIAVVAGAARSRAEMILTFFLWCLWNFKMSQSAFRSWMFDGFRFRSWGASGAPGWFQNSGEFGIEMCVFFPIVGYFLIGLWPNLSKTRRIVVACVALSAVVGAVASSSRGALVGLGMIGFWILLRSKQRVKAGVTVLVLSAMVWVVLPPESKKRWTEAGEDDTSTRRLQYWKDGIKIAEAHPAFGIGYKNWMPYYTANYNRAGQLPHNIFIECVAELGYTGLAVFVFMIFGTFRQNYLTRKLTSPNARAPDRVAFFMAYGLDGALVGYLASGMFVTVLFYPFFWINMAFTMALWRYASDRVPVGALRPRRKLGASQRGQSQLAQPQLAQASIDPSHAG